MNPGVCPGLSTCWSCPGSLLPGVGPKLLLPMSKHSLALKAWLRC